MTTPDHGAAALDSGAPADGACCGCAGCGTPATRRLALCIGGRAAAVVPLCAGHAAALRHKDWAMQVEEDWGGPLVLDGRQAEGEQR